MEFTQNLHPGSLMVESVRLCTAGRGKVTGCRTNNGRKRMEGDRWRKEQTYSNCEGVKGGQHSFVPQLSSPTHESTTAPDLTRRLWEMNYKECWCENEQVLMTSLHRYWESRELWCETFLCRVQVWAKLQGPAPHWNTLHNPRLTTSFGRNTNVSSPIPIASSGPQAHPSHPLTTHVLFQALPHELFTVCYRSWVSQGTLCAWMLTVVGNDVCACWRLPPQDA